MKKSILSIIAICSVVVMLQSCGAQYKPMTEEEIQAKATEMFQTDGQTAIDAATAECEAGMQAAVDAKVAELLATPAAPAI